MSHKLAEPNAELLLLLPLHCYLPASSDIKMAPRVVVAVVLLFAASQAVASDPVPLVMWHGMGKQCGGGEGWVHSYMYVLGGSAPRAH